MDNTALTENVHSVRQQHRHISAQPHFTINYIIFISQSCKTESSQLCSKDPLQVLLSMGIRLKTKIISPI